MIRVLIVDDSAFNRVTLQRLLSSAPGIQVVGTARDGYDAIRCIRELRPDVLTLDLEMPEMDGLSLLRWVMQEHPLPVLVVTSRESNYSLFEALDLGALDFVLKPDRVSRNLASIRDLLISKLRAIATSKLRPRPRAPAPEPAPSVPLARRDSPCRLVVLVASTGGPPAIQTILRDLPAGFPAAVAVAQHMPPFFTAAFARRLNGITPLAVREGGSGEPLRPGEVVIAPGGAHMTLHPGADGEPRLRIGAAGREDRHVPSGNLLLASAVHWGDACVGVVLTGMGDDGVDGLAALRHAGGMTFAESEASAVVYGMPRQALARGAAVRALELHEVAPTLAVLTGNETFADSWRAGDAGESALHRRENP